jgi:hypothetical protein
MLESFNTNLLIHLPINAGGRAGILASKTGIKSCVHVNVAGPESPALFCSKNRILSCSVALSFLAVLFLAMVL